MSRKYRLRRLFGRLLDDEGESSEVSNSSSHELVVPPPSAVPATAGVADNSHPGATPIALGDLGVSNLWEEAYTLLRTENAELVDSYAESLLAEASPQPGTTSREAKLEALVQEKLEDIQARQWTVTFGGKEIVIRDQVRRVVQTVIAAKDVVSAAIVVEPHAAIAWAGVLLILPLVANPVKQGEDVAEGLEVISDLLLRCRFMENVHVQHYSVSSDSKKPEEYKKQAASLRKKTIDIYSLILKYQILVAKQYSRSTMFRFLRDVVVADNWANLLMEIERVKQAINEDLEILSQGTLKDIDGHVRELQDGQRKILDKLMETDQKIQGLHLLELLETLPTVFKAAFNDYEEGAKSQCLDGTQLGTLTQIQSWIEDPKAEPIFWLRGMAGTGKSTIARTAAHAFNQRRTLVGDGRLADEVCLGGSFFFNRTDAERNHARHFFPSLARQLSETIPRLKTYVANAIEQHHAIGNEVLANQWRELIINPLTKLGKRQFSQLTVVLVVDALDECQSTNRAQQDDMSIMLSLLPEARELGTVSLRVFITSRPDWAVSSQFATVPRIYHCDVLLPKIAGPDRSRKQKDDITLFIEAQLSHVRNIHGLDGDWPGDSKVHSLVVKAEGLFIYASTACLFLRGTRKMNYKLVDGRLEKLLSTTASANGAQANLDNMYTSILQSSLLADAEDDELLKISEDFRYIVGSIVNVAEPLSVDTLSKLLGSSLKDTETALEPLQSVLSVPIGTPEPVELLHLSFRDFLLDGVRCKDDRFVVDEKEAHGILFRRCLETMSSSLCRDVCKLRHVNTRADDIPKSVVQNSFPPHVQYSCVHWSDHFRLSNIVLINDGELLQFLKSHFTHWIEAMAILGKVSRASQMINDMKRVMSVSSSKLRPVSTAE
ncbi:hypothetical protein BJY01DRAFT_221446 [Aspergillus pseudoustus]|uniref:NWD NACHT-NTPase N-terminal domain-containing protein n=1 Tax=Aspergillus pseudoustus TaxID=1810923 RepID=A0ABR4JAE5_9EURO